jgi:hypothetical protein
MFQTTRQENFMIAQQILEALEAEVTKQSFKSVKPLQVDKWLAASILQKAIRRNDLKSALSAAFTLWHLDRNSFWRRLHIISVEDVGVASPDAVIQTLTALNNHAWRKKVGDLQVGLHLTKLLCTSVKTRLGDEVYTICNKSRDLCDFRHEISKWNNQSLSDCILNINAALPERALSLWLLAGTKRFPSDVLPKHTGSMEAVADVILALNAPDDLTNACLGALTKTQWPLVLFTPLLWTEVHKQQKILTFRSDPYPASSLAKGIPLVALDMFTRLGKASYSQLRGNVPELHPFTIQQIGMSVFYSEGYCIDRRISSDAFDDYRQMGELADAEGSGLDLPEYFGLKDLIIQNTDLLNTLRQEQISRYFTIAQGELFSRETAA